MDYSDKIDTVRRRIEELKKTREALLEVDNRICAIEKEISDIDGALPDEAAFYALKDRREIDQLNYAFDLIDEAYALIDEMIGPPDETPEAPKKGSTRFS